MEPVAEVAVGQRERLAEALGEHRLGYVRPYAGYCLCGEWGSPEDPITYTVAEAYPGHLADVALAHFAAELEGLLERVTRLAEEWMRNESVSADYQDGLADCAEELRAAVAAVVGGGEGR